MLSASRQVLAELESEFARLGLSCRWFTQPADISCFQSRILTSLSDQQTAELANWLTGRVRAFEIAQFQVEGSLYLFHSSLGLRRLAIDGAGEITLRVGEVESLLESAVGNLREFQRLLRNAQAVAWQDMLEPLRRSLPRLDQLPRAV